MRKVVSERKAVGRLRVVRCGVQVCRCRAVAVVALRNREVAAGDGGSDAHLDSKQRG
jgi:hypothetical protein